MDPKQNTSTTPRPLKTVICWLISIFSLSFILIAIYFLDVFFHAYQNALLLEKLRYHASNRSSAEQLLEDPILGDLINREDKAQLTLLRTISSVTGQQEDLQEKARNELLNLFTPRQGQLMSATYNFAKDSPLLSPLLETTLGKLPPLEEDKALD